MSDAVEGYLSDLHEIHSSGSAVDETSYYGALETLLNQIGRQLKPKVRCILNPRNRGAGIPDGGLFTPDQLQGAGSGIAPGQLPSRGVVEAKGADADLKSIARTEQVQGYCAAYGQVLLTNYREFLLVIRDDAGRVVPAESYSLAPGSASFWAAAAHPRRTTALYGEPLVEFLQRAMMRPAAIATPQELAWFLASYARDARARIESAPLPALGSVRAALEEALGMQFQGARGDHFFRSTLVQALFYGVFSAWILWTGQRPAPGARFDWWSAARYLQVPVIRKLFHEIVDPGQMRELKLSEVLDWAAAALNRVDVGAFSARFQEEHAVQYFYEPFLEAYDPELRKQLGVWYTPPEIVHYMVERVDTVLRQELGIEDGLADERVRVLDPCCGTGAYLVEVLRRIESTLRAKGDDALVAGEVRAAAIKRVFGFEIMPAPFVVAHLQLGLLLQRLGAPLSEERNDRAAVYLTNALTGWEPPSGPRQQFLFPEFEEERASADRIKHTEEILVILGNPPYNGFAGTEVREEHDLTAPYRRVTRAPAPQGQGLNDLYVRFFRMAERRIVEHTGRGIVCFISNYSWLDGLSFTGMRERYLDAFDRIWIDCLHGDRKISEYAPDGRTSETIFAIGGSSPGIKVGTSIAVMALGTRTGESSEADVLYRDLNHARAAERRAALAESLNTPDFDQQYIPLAPVAALGLPLRPRNATEGYLGWPLLPELFPVSFPGVKTSRDDLLVDVDRERLIERMERYFDPRVPDQEIARLMPSAVDSTARFDARATRQRLIARGFLPQNVVRYFYRPFDLRWLYWEPQTKLLDEKRSDYFPHVVEANLWLSAGQRNRKEEFYQPQVTRRLADHHIVESNVGMFPLYLHPWETQAGLFDGSPEVPHPNLSMHAQVYFHGAGDSANGLFNHVLAVLHSPLYRVENAGALRQDWPRVPLPADRDALQASAALGRRVAALLDVESPVPGVTTGTPRPELRPLGVVTRVPGSPTGDLDLRVAVGWGHAGQGGITMPGQGRLVAREYTSEELGTLEEGGKALGLSFEQTLRLLGEGCLDVYLNDSVYWRNVPARVWGYTLGGYQVVKKWLSYREAVLLGRALRPDEARHVTEMVRRVAALLLMEPELDAAYEAAKAAPFPWPPR